MWSEIQRNLVFSNVFDESSDAELLGTHKFRFLTRWSLPPFLLLFGAFLTLGESSSIMISSERLSRTLTVVVVDSDERSSKFVVTVELVVVVLVDGNDSDCQNLR